MQAGDQRDDTDSSGSPPGGGSGREDDGTVGTGTSRGKRTVQRRRAQLMSAVVRSAMDAFIGVDHEQRIVLFNAAAEAMFQYPERAALGLSISRLIPERFRPVHDRHLRAFLERGTTARAMGRLEVLWGLRASGEEFPIEASIAKTELDGDCYGVVIVRDISARQREQAARTRQHDYITEAAGIGLWDWDPVTDRREWSPRCRAIFGVPADETVSWDRFLAALHPDDRDRTKAAIRQALQGGREYDHQHRAVWPDGSVHWVHAKGRVEFGADGRPRRMAGIAMDITDYKTTEQALLDSQERLRLARQVAQVGDFEWNIVANSMRWSPELAVLYGLPAEAFTSTFEAWLARLHPDDLAGTAQRARTALTTGRFDAEWRVVWPDGSVHWLAGRAVVYKDEAGRPERVLGVNIDVTEQKDTQETIRRVSQHDGLTGLPNRALLHEFAAHLLVQAQRSGSGVAFLFVDLDRFKPINDTYGHNVGDAVLKEVAKRLSTTLRGEDLVGRLGGDEFLVVLNQIRGEEDATKVALNVLHALGEPYRVMGLELHSSPSIGISLFPQDAAGVDALIRNADTAMYQAKAGGRNTFQFFRPELNARADEALRVESRLPRALADHEFTLHFQPVVDLRTGALVAAEALIRWPAMKLGPEQFIPVAETAGYIDALGRWTLEEACRCLRDWREHGLPEFPVAVNISALQFRRTDFVRRVTQTIDLAGISPRDLRLEITESTAMSNIDSVAEVLRGLRGHGVKVALDDFGTGHSSLSQLSRLPLDILKLDRSFVKEIGRQQRDRGSIAILEAIIAMARSLGLDLVAEGVESEKHIAFLRKRACRHAQGFHFAHPLPAEEFEDWCLRRAA